ncbi:MAG: ATP-binding cassette domain-containing protein, partial [Pseudomonadota bacterium]
LQEAHNMGVILITHDLTIVRQVSDRVSVMRLGEHVESAPTETLFTAPDHPYTQRLLSSEPSGHPRPVDEAAEQVLKVDDLRVEFDLKWGGMFSRKRKLLIAVNDLSLGLKNGESLGVVGESGSGKSTLGKAILRLLTPNGGEILWKGDRLDSKTKAEMRPFRTKLQVVFQDPFSSLNPRLSVKQIIEEGLVVNGLGGTAAERDQLVRQALVDVDIDPNVVNRFPHEFSGGQRQRIAIARALVLRPEFIVLDEPTSALDLSVQAQVVDLLRDLQAKYGLTYLFISHDLKVVRALCHRIVVMKEGQMVEQGSVDDVLENPQTDYTKRLVEAAFLVDA